MAQQYIDRSAILRQQPINSIASRAHGRDLRSIRFDKAIHIVGNFADRRECPFESRFQVTARLRIALTRLA